MKLMVMASQISLLWILSWLGDQTARILAIPVPGTVLGVVILFVLLVSGVLPVRYVQTGADFLLKHLIFFFIPVTVGLMNWGELFMNHALALTAAIVIGAVLPLGAVGVLTQSLPHREAGK